MSSAYRRASPKRAKQHLQGRGHWFDPSSAHDNTPRCNHGDETDHLDPDGVLSWCKLAASQLANIAAVD